MSERQKKDWKIDRAPGRQRHNIRAAKEFAPVFGKKGSWNSNMTFKFLALA